MPELKNPKELVSIVRNQTFAVQNELVKAECEDGAEPLKFYSHFSRFPIVIINAERKATTANIAVKDIPDMVARTNFAYTKELEMAYMPRTVAPTPTADGEDLSTNIAFTTVLTLGNGLKGKTPAQLVMEDPNNVQKLNNQYKWLKESIEKNPKFADNNKKQMDAIVEAGRLYKAGKLSGDAATTASASVATPTGQGIVIYETGMRPLVRRKRPDGKCFVYEAKVEWILGNKYPVNVEIQNYYAPVTKDSRGLLNVKASEKDNVVRNLMRLTASDWEYVMYMIQTNMRTFENAMGNFAYKTATDAAKANREKAGIKENREEE